MNGFQIRAAIMSVLAKVKEGMALINKDCATEGKSMYHRDLTILGDEGDYHAITLGLNGAINFIRTSTDGGDYHGDVNSETQVTFIIGPVRVVVQFNNELQEIHFVFTDRRDEAHKAEIMANEHLSRIMGLEAL